MLFKTPDIGRQFAGVHPELREVLNALDVEVVALGMPELTLTHVLRTLQEQEEMYWRIELQRSRVMTEEAARAKARRRRSWHCHAAAVDFRNTVYSKEERARIRRWLTSRCEKPMWEILEHDIGRGDHFHVGRVDFLWLRDWEQKQREGLV